MRFAAEDGAPPASTKRDAPLWTVPSEVPVTTTAFDQLLELTGGKTAESNPGFRLVLNAEHLDRLAAESHPGGPALLRLANFASITVFGYRIRIDDTATEMHLEPV